jgi:hypothetical protein
MRKIIIAVLAIVMPIMAAETPVQSIDYAHERIHEGVTFKASLTNTLGANVVTNICIATTNTALFRVGAPPKFHFIYNSSSSGQIRIDFIEAPTIVGIGVAASTVNRNRQSSKTAWANIFYSTNCTGGTLLESSVVGTTTGNVGGQRSQRPEIILKTNTIYNLRITSIDSGNYISIEPEWYELR